MSYKIIHNHPLINLNSFHLDVNARYFVSLKTIDELQGFIKNDFKNLKEYFILGGGSNVLFKGNYNGLIIEPVIKGINKIKEDNNNVLLKVGCGEIWDEVVEFCVTNNFGGIENLSLIPGRVGAVPVQNIGAYGVEAKNVIEKVIAVELNTAHIVEFYNNDCHFGYRSSIFKNKLKDKYIVAEVVFKLDKKHKLVTNYGNVLHELTKIGEPNIRNLRRAIINIRENKLPDPSKIGNAGSFFKNPVILAGKFEGLKSKYPQIPFFQSENHYKIPAAWLIEQCGWKGKRIKNCGTFPSQPLVLVNYGNATGDEIYQLSLEIEKSVLGKFNIQLEREVIVV